MTSVLKAIKYFKTCIANKSFHYYNRKSKWRDHSIASAVIWKKFYGKTFFSGSSYSKFMGKSASSHFDWRSWCLDLLIYLVSKTRKICELLFSHYKTQKSLFPTLFKFRMNSKIFIVPMTSQKTTIFKIFLKIFTILV